MADWVEEQIVKYEWTGNVNTISYGQILVRCKDCIRRGNPRECIVAKFAEQTGTPYFVVDNRGEWFCADGVAKDIDVPNKEGWEHGKTQED